MHAVIHHFDIRDGKYDLWLTRGHGDLVFTLLYRLYGAVTDVIVVHTKRRCPLGAKKAERNGAVSFAQKLLDRKKEVEGSHVVASDAELEALHPHMVQLLTTRIIDDKKVLEPASLTLYCRMGSWHGCLKHKALELGWWGEGPTLKTCLAAVEAAVTREEGQEAPRSP